MAALTDKVIQMVAESALSKKWTGEKTISIIMQCLDDPTSERCLEKDESVTYILCDCEAMAYLRFCHLGQFLWNQVTAMAPP
jgi:hypothetical protein